MNVTSNSIARFLHFLSKLRNRNFNPTGIGDEGAGLVAVIVPKFAKSTFSTMHFMYTHSMYTFNTLHVCYRYIEEVHEEV